MDRQETDNRDARYVRKVGADFAISSMMDETLDELRRVFANDGTLRTRVIMSADGTIRCGLVYLDGMTDRAAIQDHIIRPVMNYRHPEKEEKEPSAIMERIRTSVVTISDVVATEELEELLGAMVSGNAVLLMDGYNGALMLSTQGWETRQVSEPLTEKGVRGPREGFTESLPVNLTLIRRRVQDPDLKFVFSEVGYRSRTQVCVCYMESLVPEGILRELQDRLSRVEIDQVLDTGYLAELIRDEPYSPFETVGSTERPDSVVGKIMEGRVALLMEGSPFALTVPFLFMENFQASEDYYVNYYFASFNRILRILGGFMSISVPAIYCALVTYSQEMVPTMLLMSIASARLAVPFPTVVEALLMLVIFEILREAGARIPTMIGQAVSIVGALVLGQAAVDARIVSAPMVIVVGLTGITSLLNPRLTGALIVCRFLLLFCGCIMGTYGYFFGLLALIIHLMSLRSFGVSYMIGTSSFRFQDIKDTAIRAPWWDMYLRPAVIGIRNRKRKSDKQVKRQ